MPNPPNPDWNAISGVPAALMLQAVVVVSAPVATTMTPVPVEEVEVRAARDAAKPTERGAVGGGWVELVEEQDVAAAGGGSAIGWVTGVVGVPAARKGRLSLGEELMMEGRRPRPPMEELSGQKEPFSPSREAWERR